MPVPNITPLPDAPIRSKYSEQFANQAEAFVSALPQFSQEMNDAAVYVQDRAAEVDLAQQAAAASELAAEGYRDESLEAKDAAMAMVNFAGKWSELAGALNTPAVVFHQGAYWNLLNNLADVTTSEPAHANADWLMVYEIAAKNNLTATVDPSVNDDDTQGYGPTSRWVNQASGEFWLCISAGTGAAVWQKATLTVDELGSAALAETTDFDPAGTGASAAASAVGAHEAAADPHTQYAELAGGAAADFLSMPLISGDALQEYGSNANGAYWRFASGLQICTHNTLTDPGVTMAAVGSVYRSDGNLEWTYPAAFMGVPALGSSGANANSWYNTAGGCTATVGAWRQFAYTNVAVTVVGYWFAVGKWK